MIIDPSCAIVFEMEAPESNVMQRPPRASNEKIFNFQNSSLAILQGLGLLIIVIGLYLVLMKVGETPSFASTIAFGSLMLGNLSLIIVSRSKQLHFFAILKRRNSSQYWIIGSAISLFSAFLLTPFLRERFGFAEITIEGVILILFSGLIGLIWYEAIKIFYRIKLQ
jgi:Ca2+-transporting ATPase